MKTAGIIILFGTYCLLHTGCRKPVYHTISGHLYADCSLTPLQNHYVELNQGLTGGLGPTAGGFLTSGYTDSTGYFALVFDSQNNQTIKLMDENQELMLDFPPNDDSEDVTVYRYPTTNIQVILNVINAYEAGDTLTISSFNTGMTDWLKVPCPLSSGVLYTSPNFPVSNYAYNGSYTDIIWWINDYKIQHFESKDFYINAYCNDTVFVTIDIY